MNMFLKFLLCVCVVVVVAQCIGMLVQFGLFIHHYFCLKETPNLYDVYRNRADGCGGIVSETNPGNSYENDTGKNDTRSWVVITGASSGQGKEFALQLAGRGFHIVLIGSRRSHGVASLIREKGVDCIVILKDFGKAFEDDFFDDISKTLEPLDVAVLINNVGHRTGWQPFHESPVQCIRNTIACGTMVQTRLTHLLLPQMIARLDTNTCCRSAIVFVTAQCMHPNSGLAAAGLFSNEISVPYLATYEASNAYGFYNACSLIKEYQSVDRLDMLNITPGAVITENTAHTLRSTPFSVSAKEFVANVIRFMAGNIHNGTTCAYWGHALSNALIGCIPFYKDAMLEKVGKNISSDYMQRYTTQETKYDDERLHNQHLL